MSRLRFLQSALLLASLPLCTGFAAIAAESQASSAAGGEASSQAQVEGASEASHASSSLSGRESSTSAGSKAASQATGATKPITTAGSGGQQQQPIVRNIGVVPSHQSAASSQKRSAHWKTRYWNQKPRVKKTAQ